MAELTEIDGGKKDIAVPVIAKASEIDKAAEQMRKQRELPKKPGPNVMFKEMVDWLKLLSTDEMLSRIVIYVYRLDPPIIRQKVDPDADNNIDIYIDGFHELSEERVIEAHGGGTYRFIVRDDDSKRNAEGHFQAKLTVPISVHPPKLDLREVDWEHKNCKGFRAWARAKRLIDDNNMPIIEQKGQQQNTQQANTSTDTTALVKMMIEFVTKMNSDQQAQFKKNLGAEDSVGKGVQELLLEKMKQDDPNKHLQTITALMSAVKNNEPKTQPDNTMVTIVPLFMQMMQNQQAASDKQFQLMLEMMKENKKGSGEETSEVDKLRALIELSKEMKGGSTGSKSTAEVVAEVASSLLAPTLQIVGNIMQMKANQTQQTNGNPNMRPNVTQSATETITKQNAQQGSVVAIDAPNGPTAEEAAQVFQQFGPLIFPKLGDDGWKFGALAAEMFGDPVVASIVKHGEDGLLKAAKLVPAFWDQVVSTYGEPHFRKWLTSFVNFREEAKKFEDEEFEEETDDELKK